MVTDPNLSAGNCPVSARSSERRAACAQIRHRFRRFSGERETGLQALKADFQLGLPGSEGSSFADAMAMTAARCVNSVEAVVQASPGFKTFLDLPPLTGKYAKHDR